MPVKRAHHDLMAWQQAVQLVETVYLCTQALPADERFGLTAQIRRSAVSVASNVAEGVARSGSKEFLHFLNMARGSLSELETQLIIARNLRYIEPDNAVFSSIETVFGLLGGLINSIRKTTPP